MTSEPPAIGATTAVDDVSFEIAEGTVHALLGENGAGKSTIVKLLSGLIVPDAGEFRIFGDHARLTSPRSAHRHGIQTAFQEMTLIPDLPVLDNMLLPYGPISLIGTIKRRAAEAMVSWTRSTSSAWSRVKTQTPSSSSRV